MHDGYAQVTVPHDPYPSMFESKVKGDLPKIITIDR